MSARLPSILVATDGSTTSLSAYTAADLIAARRGAQVHVLSVLRPFPVMVPPLSAHVVTSGVDRADAEVTEKVVREQLAKISRSAEWTIETRAGAPASTIARAARDRCTDIIIIGESHHGRVDRLLGEETSSQLARRVNLPLLVASAAMCRLPRRVVIAFDLTSDDFSAAARALEILGAPPGVSCVHVQPRAELLGVDWAEYDGEYRAQVQVTFERMKQALTAVPRIQPELVVLHGDPATEINAFAESVKAEMIVLGLKPRGAISLSPGGGVAMKVTRASHRLVLLIPRKTTKDQTRGSTQ
jgi:nucleotide-binding universal stress UspA family protein